MHYNYASHACVLQFVLVVYFQGTLRLDTTHNKSWFSRLVGYCIFGIQQTQEEVVLARCDLLGLALRVLVKPAMGGYFFACIQKSIQQRTAPGPIATCQSKAQDELVKTTDEGNATFAAFQAEITYI